MDTVYKYCDARGVKILEELELKVTPPNQFNDPFEFTPRIVCTSVKREIKHLLRDKKELRGMFLESKNEGFTGNFRDYRKQWKEIRATVISKIEPQMPEACLDLQAKCPNIISRGVGVLCLSIRPDSIVMWGHYGNKHSGMVIGFDRSWGLFQREKGLRPIEYVRERVRWDSSWMPGGSEEKAYVDQLIFCKNDEWKYEEEMRQLFRLSGLRQRSLDNGAIGYFLPIPPEVVRTVYLGMRCSPKLEDTVRCALRDPRLSHVQLNRAALDDNNFALKFE